MKSELDFVFTKFYWRQFDVFVSTREIFYYRIRFNPRLESNPIESKIWKIVTFKKIIFKIATPNPLRNHTGFMIGDELIINFVGWKKYCYSRKYKSNGNEISPLFFLLEDEVYFPTYFPKITP